MLYFASSRFLWLLLLVPVILLAYGFVRYRRVGRIRAMGDEKLVRDFMPSWSGARDGCASFFSALPSSASFSALPGR